MRAHVFVLAGLFAITAAPLARAEGTELDDLKRQLARDYEALSAGASDCALACKALSSLERSAARLCELSPGPTCDDAKGKAEKARAQVRAACPMCAAPLPPAPPTPTQAPDEAHVQTAAAPPAESKRGGCAGCATTPMDPGDFSQILVVAGLVVARLRRASRKRRAERS